MKNGIPMINWRIDYHSRPIIEFRDEISDRVRDYFTYRRKPTTKLTLKTPLERRMK